MRRRQQIEARFEVDRFSEERLARAYEAVLPVRRIRFRVIDVGLGETGIESDEENGPRVVKPVKGKVG